MPEVLDRRALLKQIGTAAALASVAGQWTLAQSVSVARLALLSDTHISRNAFDRFRGFSPHENLSRVVDQVIATELHLVLVNGDLSRQQGEVLDYLQFNSFIQPIAERRPVALTLGNHDDRANFRASSFRHAGDQQAVASKQVSTLDIGPIRFVMLDSLMTTNVAQGELGDTQRKWLGSYLDSKADKPIIVFVHHNPDPEALVDTNLLLGLLKQKPAVKALIYGHRHVYRFDQVDGLHLVNLPAVGYNFEDGNPVGWVEATFSPQAADFKLHAVGGDTAGNGRVTHVEWR